MNRWPDIQYLRWARSQASPPFPEISLVQSGMAAPDPAVLGDVTTSDLLHFPVEDHPPLAHRLAEEWKVAPERVMIQPGTHLSLFLLLAARLGDAPGPVVVEEPAYQPLWALPQALGAPVLRWPRPRANAFALDPDAVDRLAQARPSVVVLSHPHNPTGALLTDDDLRLVRSLQERTGCAVIADEVYHEFAAPGSTVEPRRVLENVAITRSFTKVLGLATLRCTGLTAPEAWIERVAASSDHLAITVSGPSQALAHRAWDQRHGLWDRARAAADAGRAIVEAWSLRNEGRVEVTLSPAGIICFPRPDEETHAAALAFARAKGVEGPFGFGLDDVADGAHVWIEDFRRRHGVQLTPGAFFDDARAFRLGYGGSPDVLRRGLERLDHYFRAARERAAEHA